MAQPFSQDRLRVRPSSREEAVVASAREHFERTLIRVRGAWVGSVAALEHPRRSGDLNYGEVFLRDNVPVMLYLLLQGRTEIVRNFLDTCLDLQSSTYQTRGVFPTSFIEEGGTLLADYGQRSIGRITSVDASLWWPVLCWLYVRRSRDVSFGTSQKVQRGIQLLLDLVLHPSFEGTPVLFVPDCAFMIDRPMDVWGAPLEVEVLLYGCLRSCAKLMELARREAMSRLLDQRLVLTRQWLHDLRSYLLKHYWVTSKTMQVLRRRPTEQYGEHQHENEFNVQPQVIPAWLQDWLDNRGGYLIGNMRTGRPDFRFYSLGNSLACLFGLLTAPQQRALFRLVLHNREHLMAQMPMRICHPPMEGDEWVNKTGSDPKNWPWSYHNGGHWPSLLWYLGGAVLLHEQQHPTADLLLMGQMKAMLEECYWAQLNQLPRQQWAEYFDGPTGTWVGLQARTYQTWTIVGFLLLHHLLRVEPRDADLLNIGEL
ncbi:MAG: glycoside hydrolase 100 family protein [Cyanobacteriota bacterium]|nr:glycoside hydrolase 100 family protein [Cyanobacteriota bacterium]